jgi:maltooligosyltrehalose trehalohydrolase
MTEICVWAPRAGYVELETDNLRSAMVSEAGGWWKLDVPWLKHGVDYAFRLDGRGPFPDPRSAWQPAGVHGSSRWVEHDRFAWSDGGWQAPPLAAGIIEEIHVGTFTPQGTFEAAIEYLDHLLEIGITHVELMPVAEFPGNRGWGYDGVALFAPHEAYGGPEGLKHFVNACHRKGLAVLLDVVYNHLGPDGNYLSCFGPYFTDAYTTPWGEAVNLDRAYSDEVRRFFLDNALSWLRDYHLDGLRIDAVHAIYDTSAIHFLEELAQVVCRLEACLGRHFVLIAESDLNDPRLVRPPEAGGFGLDAMWNEDFHHALHAILTLEKGGYYQDFGKLSDIERVMTKGLVYDGGYSVYRKRRHGRSAVGLPGRCFIGCLQNHDQVGNRAKGERTSHLLSSGLLKIGAALVLTSPFIPMLFQGEEWGASTPFLYFTDHPDPELAEAVRQGRRSEFSAFGWNPATIPDPQAMDTFERSQLIWDDLHHKPHHEILQWHKALIRLRHSLPALMDDRLETVDVRFDEAAAWLLVIRGGVVIACNLGKVEQKITLLDLCPKHLLLASDQGVVFEDKFVLLPGETVAIFGEESKHKIPWSVF